MRRIITGHNAEGKSVITIDGPPARSLSENEGGLYELWNTDGDQINTLDDIDRADNEVLLSPPDGGTKFRCCQINPTPEGVPADLIKAATAEAFEKMGAGFIPPIVQYIICSLVVLSPIIGICYLLIFLLLLFC